MDSVTYPTLFQFEDDFHEPSFMKWMLDNWTRCFIYSALYVTVIFGGKWYMQHRPRYELRPVLALWSGILAIFSILGAIRTIPEWAYILKNHGLQHSACVPDYFDHRVPAFWAMLFTVSKVYELGDTIFIVLRKQPLIFLHWYHHVTVLIYSWYSYIEHTAPGRWFMVMNYTVHSIMYTYYTLRALKFTIPKVVSMCITLAQLIQMTIGFALIIWVYQIKGRGEYCQQSYSNLRCGFMVYGSYFILFAQFFYNSYIKPSTKATQNNSVKSTVHMNGVKKID